VIDRPAGFAPDSSRIAVVWSSGERAVAAAAAIARKWLDAHPSASVVEAPAPALWPFLPPERLANGHALIWAPNLHEAFVNRQTGGTRLVTTQGGYLLLSWLARTAGHPALLLGTADRAMLAADAPELLARRGALSAIYLHDDAAPAVAETSLDPARSVPHAAISTVDPAEAAPAAALAEAFRLGDPAARLAQSVQALNRGRTASTLLAAASVCMEVNDLEAAGRDLDEAVSLAPDWPAAHFERGKLWLRRDDMERASESFRAAAERLPAFGSAWANLGATLGELDRPEEALAAFERALACDPSSHQALNNIGVVRRELGNLAESEAAFRQVIALAPALAFGHYNLGHTLFLQGRYQAALSAYAEGQKRDAERNPVQATRLALCRLATGDPDGALAELRRAVTPLPADYRRQLLADTGSILLALLTHRPDVTGWDRVNGWVSGELRKLA
jgi:tetratricopeptide (TPR) repeat protein